MNLASPMHSALVWFRRDLRDEDHAALASALRHAQHVFCTFVFDDEILTPLRTQPPTVDRRVSFIHASLRELDTRLRNRGGGLIVRAGDPRQQIPQLAQQLKVGAVFANRDYEPYAKARDHAVAKALSDLGIHFHTSKDQVIFDRDEVLTAAGTPFCVFTPYRRAWLRRLEQEGISPYSSSTIPLAPCPHCDPLPELRTLGFQEVCLADSGLRPGMSGASACWQAFIPRIPHYAEDRNFPAITATSGLSPHLRFGTISIRHLVSQVCHDREIGAQSWLSELIWRDFYAQILDHFPSVVTHAFKPALDHLSWAEWPESLEAWKNGQTGYPLVDAAMRQLATTGHMHNRLRMVCASFLCKDLGIDWRLGESHFASLLNDFDLASNNGGWQWSASTGCDAQPWFRVFNPVTQSEKFDPDGVFIRRFIPELLRVPARYIHAPWRMPADIQSRLQTHIGKDYPCPIVYHEEARQITLARYQNAVRK